MNKYFYRSSKIDTENDTNNDINKGNLTQVKEIWRSKRIC